MSTSNRSSKKNADKKTGSATAAHNPAHRIKFNADHFKNRELSWLRFNYRVFQEARRKSNPLLEKIKFLGIVASNLDEFFEVRVSGLEQKLESGSSKSAADGLTPQVSLKRIYRIVNRMINNLYTIWNKEIIPQLKKEGYEILEYSRLNEEQREYLEEYYEKQLQPVLTPIKVDPAHPFPWLINKAICIATLLNPEGSEEDFQLGIITLPRVLPRILELPSNTQNHGSFIFLREVVEANINRLFKGYQISGSAAFRITRNSNLYLNEEEASNLLQEIQKELHNRRKGDAVRLEIKSDSPVKIIEYLRDFFQLADRQVHQVNGPVNFYRVMSLYKMIDRDDLKDEQHVPAKPDWMSDDEEDLFTKISEKDRLLHHPYETFEPVIKMLHDSAIDDNVLAIKMTLYRTGEESPIIQALIEAAARGKEVTVVLELKARFDEESNVNWAKYLLDNGVHVVYGLLGLKTHSKLILVVRQGASQIRKYVHIGTGNYNQSTAKLYTDLSLFTCNSVITDDVVEVFNMLTSQSKQPVFKKLLVSPYFLLKKFLSMIDREIRLAKQGKKARIIFKVNALQDEDIIKALYRASAEGVEIIGIVRGICCLKPHRKGLSENIKIISIVGRFLEHSRIYYFENGAPHRTYMGSADWMPRNLKRRVEVITPILDKDIEKRILTEILEAQLHDNYNAREIDRPFKFPETKPNKKDSNYFCSQSYFIAQSKGMGDKISIPSDKKYFEDP